MKIKKQILLSAITLALFSIMTISACKKEDNTSHSNTGGGGSTGTCTDGIKNQNETGVDCGGVCTPCAGAPVACFTLSDDTISAGGSVSFTNCTTLGTSYSWNFGDGQTSTTTSPSHTYTTAGIYTVTLTATNAVSTNSKTAVVRVLTVGNQDYAGTFSASEVCTSGTYTYTMTVTASGAQSIVLNNFGGFGSAYNINGTVSGLNFTIPSQVQSGDNFSGSGTLSANFNNMSITYTVVNGSNTDNCVATCTRQ